MVQAMTWTNDKYQTLVNIWMLYMSWNIWMTCIRNCFKWNTWQAWDDCRPCGSRNPPGVWFGGRCTTKRPVLVIDESVTDVDRCKTIPFQNHQNNQRKSKRDYTNWRIRIEPRDKERIINRETTHCTTNAVRKTQPTSVWCIEQTPLHLNNSFTRASDVLNNEPGNNLYISLTSSNSSYVWRGNPIDLMSLLP